MNSLDLLRGMYVRSPSWVRRSLMWPISLLPVSLRYGRSYLEWRKRIQAMRDDPLACANHVLEARTNLLRLAYSRSPYYGEILAPLANSFLANPKQIISDADWRRVPILTKPTIQAQSERILTKPKESLDVVSTSGTSGRPIAFYLDRNRSVVEFAFVNDAWSRAGYQEGDLRCVFRGVLIHDVSEYKMEFEPALGELRCSPFHLTDENMSEYLTEIRRRNIRYIHGYPSAVFIFANFLARKNISPLNDIKGIFPISETLMDHQRALLQTVFPKAQIVPFYGMSEKVAFAVEEKPGEYVFDSTYGFAELVDHNGDQIRERGKRGRVVGTGLLSSGMPFIRYDTEDEACLEEPPTPENGYRLRVSGLRSRWRQEFLVSSQGSLISIAAINIHSELYTAIREFQFVQDEPGRAIIRVVLAANGSVPDIKNYVTEIVEKLGGVLHLDWEIVDSIAVNSRGKRRYIEQRMNLADFGLKI